MSNSESEEQISAFKSKVNKLESEDKLLEWEAFNFPGDNNAREANKVSEDIKTSKQTTATRKKRLLVLPIAISNTES
jgi:hypothetical protein